MQQYLEAGALRPPAGPSGVYQAADGWISVTVPRQHEWLAFCDAVGLPQIPDDPRFAHYDGRVENADAMRALLRPVFAAASVAHWSEQLAARKVMHERLNTYADFLAHPHTAASGAIAWVDHPAVPQKMPLPNLIGMPPFVSGEAPAVAPALGQHSTAILREHEFTESAIDDLAAREVIGLPQKMAE
jgi:crotonobetainyl-CoA:carnitine CoA-transferase CaiB-like acyl-CoA transferase